MQMPTETKKVLIVVRTYPTPAWKGVEVSCTAGITDKGEWIRLFPVPWRLLDVEKQFRKYQWVEVEVTKSSDPRPESFKLKQDTIKILSEQLSTADSWKARKEIVYPLRSESLCSLVTQRNQNQFPTLGFFRPKSIDELLLTPDTPNWTQAQMDALRQGNLFVNPPKHELEKIPYKFQYRFTCDDSECKGHTIMCSDWEMGQSWRDWKNRYGDKWEAKFRERYETEMIKKNDTQFYVGTIHQHPHKWIIIGLFYPPARRSGADLKEQQLPLIYS